MKGVISGVHTPLSFPDMFPHYLCEIPEDMKAIVKQVVRAGDEIIRSNAGKVLLSKDNIFDRESKTDRMVLREITKWITVLYPDDGIIAEGLDKKTAAELGLVLNSKGFVSPKNDSVRVWALDPVCGSTAHANRASGPVISLGLVTDIEPVRFLSGIVYEPGIRLFFGDIRNGENSAIMVSADDPAGENIRVRHYDGSEDIANSGIVAPDRVQTFDPDPRMRAAIYNFASQFGDPGGGRFSCSGTMCEVAMGAFLAMLKSKQPVWEYAAGAAICLAAGAKIVDWRGCPFELPELCLKDKRSFVCYSGDPIILEWVRKYLSEVA